MSAPDRAGEPSRIIRRGDVEAEMGLLQRATEQPRNQDFSGSLAGAGFSLKEARDLAAERGEAGIPVSGAAIASGVRRAGIRRQYVGKTTKWSEE